MATNVTSGRLLSAATLAISVGGILTIPAGKAYNAFSVSVNTTGSPSSYSVKLQGMADPTGSVWTDIGAAITADGNYSLAAATGIYFTAFRANITAVSGGTTPKISMYFTAVS